jgi:polyhydroxybutyrate depolymerase
MKACLFGASIGTVLLSVAFGCGSGSTGAVDDGSGVGEPGGTDDAGTSKGGGAGSGSGGTKVTADAGKGGQAGTVTPEASVPRGDASPSAGCGKPPTEMGITTKSVTIAGVERYYDLYNANGVTGNEPVPLVFAFHGAGGTSLDAESYGLQDAAEALKDKAIFVFPQAILYQGTIGWDCFNTKTVDMQFVDAIIDDVSATHCVDKSRLFAAGFSWGADMTIELGCFRGDVFRAIHPFSGTGTGFNGCTAQVPAFRETLGTSDPYYSVANVAKVVQHFATAQHCGTTTTQSTPQECLAYTGCDLPVVTCTYPGMSHQVPGTGGKDAWAFFKQF